MVALHQLVAADLAQIVVEQRRRFDQVAVTVDYRMVELCAERSHTADLFRIHATYSLKSDAVRLARHSERSQGWITLAQAGFHRASSMPGRLRVRCLAGGRRSRSTSYNSHVLAFP
jgi:hypothetical protein